MNAALPATFASRIAFSPIKVQRSKFSGEIFSGVQAMGESFRVLRDKDGDNDRLWVGGTCSVIWQLSLLE
jgi:hypothetical protein